MVTENFAMFKGGQPHLYQFYTGELIQGILLKDSSTKKWYLIDQRNKTTRETSAKLESGLGIEVDLRAITHMESLPEEMETYSSEISYNGSLKVILVILGAGASFDVSGQAGAKLPLTNQLFSTDYQDEWKKFDGVKALYTDLRNVGNLEAFFDSQWKILKSKYNPKLMSDLINVQYYLQYFFLKKSLELKGQLPNYYRALVRQMMNYVHESGEDYKFVVVNFNYDTLFEDTLTAELDYNFDSIQDYDNYTREILVYKPHGSSNWCRYVKSEYQNDFVLNNPNDLLFFPKHASIVFERKTELGLLAYALENRISIMTEEISKYEKSKGVPNMMTDLASYRTFLPHLLIPYSSKDEFVIPDSQVRRLANLMNYTDSIYVCGWKGSESKFLNLLSENLPKKKIHVHAFTTKNGLPQIIENLGPHIKEAEFMNSFTNGFAKGLDLVNSLGENMFNEKVQFS